MRESFKDCRFVWQQTPGENPDGNDAKDALERRRVNWGTSKAVENLKKRVTEGSETKDAPEKPRERAQNISINPTPEILDGLPTDDGSRPEHGLRKRLQYHLSILFPQRYASLFSTEQSEQYINMLRDFEEALLMRAITENWTEQELMDKFETETENLRVEIAGSDNSGEAIWNALKRFGRWIMQNPDNRTLQGENPYIQDGPIKPRYKLAVTDLLKNLEFYYKYRLKEKWGHWYGDEYNENRVNFLTEIELDFYREFYLNKAILQKQSPQTLAIYYSEFLKQRFRETIEDPTDKNQQLANDQNENKGFEWINIVKGIEAACK